MDIKVSEMPEIAGIAGTDKIMVIRSGNKASTAANIFSNIKDPVIMNSDAGESDVVIKGKNIQDLLVVDTTANKIGIKKAVPTTTIDVSGSAGIDGAVFFRSVQTQTSSGAVDLESRTTIVDDSGSIALQIGPGLIGQEKIIIRKNASAMTLSASGTTILGVASVAFNATGSTISLFYTGTEWVVLSGNNLTIS